MQSLRGGVYAIETARRLAAEKQYDALMYEGLLLSGKCLADQIGVPSIRLSSTFAYNRSILANLSDTGGLHVTSLLKFPAVVKLMSLSMRRHGVSNPTISSPRWSITIRHLHTSTRAGLSSWTMKRFRTSNSSLSASL